PSRPASTRPRALEARHDLAIVGDPRELLEPAADRRRVEGVSLTGDDALHVEDVAGTAGHALVDHQVLGRTEPYDPLLAEVVVDGPADRLFFEARQRQAQIGRPGPRHLDRQDAVLEGETHRIFQTRRKRRHDLPEGSLLPPGWQQDREIDVDREARL